MAGVTFNYIDVLGYLGASLTLATFAMPRMIPLRIIGIAANCAFISYGLATPLYPVLALHAVLLPLNVYRLREMLHLIAKVRTASRGDLSMDWLKPFMARTAARAGEVLFRKGDLSSAMFYLVSGRYRLPEIATEVGPGELIGELGLIAPGNRRTLSLECIEAGELLTISYPQVKQLYFQNPQFGFAFLQLISLRLFQDIARLEAQVAKTAA